MCIRDRPVRSVPLNNFGEMFCLPLTQPNPVATVSNKLNQNVFGPKNIFNDFMKLSVRKLEARGSSVQDFNIIIGLLSFSLMSLIYEESLWITPPFIMV